MARKKGPKFYTTKVPASQSIAEIQELLAEFEVQSYHVFRAPLAVGFVVDTAGGPTPFKVQPNIEGLRKRFNQPGTPSPRLNVEAVAWRQTREQIELMLEVVESGAFTFAEIFGGLALTSHGDTVGQAIDAGHTQLGPSTHLMIEGE